MAADKSCFVSTLEALLSDVPEAALTTFSDFLDSVPALVGLPSLALLVSFVIAPAGISNASPIHETSRRSCSRRFFGAGKVSLGSGPFRLRDRDDVDISNDILIFDAVRGRLYVAAGVGVEASSVRVNKAHTE